MSAPRVCNVPGCPRLTSSSRCAEHARPAFAGATQRTLTKTTKRRVLERDGYRCQVPLPMVGGLLCLAPASTVDHVVAVADGGTDDEWNLRAACAQCNHRSGSALGGSRGRGSIF